MWPASSARRKRSRSGGLLPILSHAGACNAHAHSVEVRPRAGHGDRDVEHGRIEVQPRVEPHWNAFVANLEMHGMGTFFNPRLDDAAQFPIAASHGFGHVQADPDSDRITKKLNALHYFQRR